MILGTFSLSITSEALGIRTLKSKWSGLREQVKLPESQRSLALTTAEVRDPY